MVLTAPLLQPIYKSMFGIHIFGLGFLTSMAFIFMTGGLSAAGAGCLWRQPCALSRLFESEMHGPAVSMCDPLLCPQDSGCCLLLMHPAPLQCRNITVLWHQADTLWLCGCNRLQNAVNE